MAAARFVNPQLLTLIERDGGRAALAAIAAAVIAGDDLKTKWQKLSPRLRRKFEQGNNPDAAYGLPNGLPATLTGGVVVGGGAAVGAAAIQAEDPHPSFATALNGQLERTSLHSADGRLALIASGAAAAGFVAAVVGVHVANRGVNANQFAKLAGRAATAQAEAKLAIVNVFGPTDSATLADTTDRYKAAVRAELPDVLRFLNPSPAPDLAL